MGAVTSNTPFMYMLNELGVFVVFLTTATYTHLPVVTLVLETILKSVPASVLPKPAHILSPKSETPKSFVKPPDCAASNIPVPCCQIEPVAPVVVVRIQNEIV